MFQDAFKIALRAKEQTRYSKPDTFRFEATPPGILDSKSDCLIYFKSEGFAYWKVGFAYEKQAREDPPIPKHKEG